MKNWLGELQPYQKPSCSPQASKRLRKNDPLLRRRQKMDDLTAAKQRLKEKELSLVFVRDSKIIFETNVEGLRGFAQAIETLGDSLTKSSIADRIVGKAAALLCAYCKAKSVFAFTMSQSGLKTLKMHKIPGEFGNLVPTILNRKKTDRCPFEKLVQGIADPKEAYDKIRKQCT